MIVFSTYLKILKRNFLSVFMVFIIFSGVSYFFVNLNSNSGGFSLDNYDIKITKVALVNNSTSIKNKGLENYLKDEFTVESIKNNERSIKDALFYGAIDYAIIINDNDYQDYTPANTNGGILVKSYVNAYLNTYQNLEKSKAYPKDELAKQTLNSLNEKVDVNYLERAITNGENQKTKTFYNLFAYAIITTLIIGISTVSMVLDKKSVLKRTIISKISVSQRNIQIFLGHTCFTIVIWLAANIAATLLVNIELFSKQHLFYLFNSFVFILSISSLSFLITNFIKNQNALSAISNIVGLGLSFISGIFIPQVVLSPFVLKIASFMPAYWYVQANERIASTEDLDFGMIIQPTLMMLVFVIVFMVISLVISKHRKNY